MAGKCWQPVASGRFYSMLAPEPCCGPLTAATKRDTFAAFSPDGRYIFTAGSRDWRSYPNREAVLWEAATGKRVRSFRGPLDAVRSLVFNDDGQRLDSRLQTRMDNDVGYEYRQAGPRGASGGSGRRPGCEKELARRIQKRRWTMDGHARQKQRSNLKNMRSSKTTMILDYELYEPLRVAFSAKSPRIAVADEGSVHVFNPETGKELATLIPLTAARNGW